MTVYQRVDDAGEVAEQVKTVDGSHEDTRLGLLALEHEGGWRIAEDEGAPAAADRPAPAAGKGKGKDAVRDARRADGTSEAGSTSG